MNNDISEAPPRYDRLRTYEWNYENPPEPLEVAAPGIPGEWTFLGAPVNSPLGIAAGPLLNGRWIRYYASLGFDILTYKTVRSRPRDCYSLPNLVPTPSRPLHGGEPFVPRIEEMEGSWAVSFGMPSADPEVWRRDMAWTRERLAPGQVLVASVVGTMQEDWSLDDLAEDYAQCAKWAIESGADAVEANFSCPNVCSRDGQLYQEPSAAGHVARRVRERIGKAPFTLKIGHIPDREAIDPFLDAVADYVDGLTMTNSIAARVADSSGSLLFDSEPRGICGAATQDASVAQTRAFGARLRARGLGIELIGVGGIASAASARRYIDAGASSVQLATAAMVDPFVAFGIRREWSTYS